MVALLRMFAAGALALASAAGLPAAQHGVVEPAKVGADPGVTMTIVNWGKPTSIDDPKHKAWAHLSANAAPVEVTVRVAPPVGDYIGFVMTFSTPDAFQGPLVQHCDDQFAPRTKPVTCTFSVPISRGANHVDMEFFAGTPRVHLVAHGIIYGGDLAVAATMQALDTDGKWQDLGADTVYLLAGELRTGLRFRLSNWGDIPFKAVGSCAGAVVQPNASKACTLRAPRPMFAVAGTYNLSVELADPAGGGAVMDLHAVLAVQGFDHGANG